MRCPRGLGYIIFPPSLGGSHLAGKLSWTMIPIVVFPQSPPSMTVVEVLGFELVVARGVPVVSEAL